MNKGPPDKPDSRRKISVNRVVEKRRIFIILQWVVVIGTSYLLLFSEGELVINPWIYSLILVLLASVLALQHFPLSVFDHKFFPPALAFTDTIIISTAILFNKESPWDFLLVFFFGLFISGIGENLILVVLGCLFIALISVLISSQSAGTGFSFLNSSMLLRVPFIFGTSLLYGYLADQVKREKSRAEKVEETAKLKRQLVSALAHDIKNPLTGIMGYADLLATGAERKGDGDEIRQALQRITDNAQQILKLITGFLDAAEAQKTEVVRQPVQLSQLIKAVVEQQAGNIQTKRLSLNLDLSDSLPEIMGDESQLERVLWNLLGNAVKFTPTGGTITVISRMDLGQICISVKDTGIGIRADEIPYLFSEFRRLGGAAEIEGSGLGLFIVKTIVESHGGGVAAESKEGSGSTFTIRLPLPPGLSDVKGQKHDFSQ